MDTQYIYLLQEREFIKTKEPIYKIGKTKSVKSVAVSKPPITTVANGRCTSAPAPLLNAIGKKPKEATAAVIKTGRRRVRVACKMMPFK